MLCLLFLVLYIYLRAHIQVFFYNSERVLVQYIYHLYFGLLATLCSQLFGSFFFSAGILPKKNNIISSITLSKAFYLKFIDNMSYYILLDNKLLMLYIGIELRIKLLSVLMLSFLSSYFLAFVNKL